MAVFPSWEKALRRDWRTLGVKFPSGRLDERGLGRGQRERGKSWTGGGGGLHILKGVSAVSRPHATCTHLIEDSRRGSHF